MYIVVTESKSSFRKNIFSEYQFKISDSTKRAKISRTLDLILDSRIIKKNPENNTITS